MRYAVAAIVLMLSGIVSGCSGEETHTASDCADQLRANGIIYTSMGVTQESARRHSVADRADCDDVGEDAVGSVFPDEPDQVSTWTFPGYQPATVLGVSVGGGEFMVFVATSASAADRARVESDLLRVE